jgi:hypothetical protein
MPIDDHPPSRLFERSVRHVTTIRTELGPPNLVVGTAWSPVQNDTGTAAIADHIGGMLAIAAVAWRAGLDDAPPVTFDDELWVSSRRRRATSSQSGWE